MTVTTLLLLTFPAVKRPLLLMLADPLTLQVGVIVGVVPSLNKAFAEKSAELPSATDAGPSMDKPVKTAPG